MFELIDKHPDVNVQEAEFIRLLGYPRGYVLEGRPRELVHWARDWYRENAHPWVYARKVDRLETENNLLDIGGTQFSSERLCRQFLDAEASEAFVVAVSAGKECEEMAAQLWLEEKPDEYFFLEMYGSAVVEHLVATTGFRFCEWADGQRVAVLPHYSPGYPGWDISDQGKLFDVLLKNRGNILPGELRVLDTGMLSPKKSLLAVFGVTARLDKVRRLTNLIPCENCSLPSCQYRRVPYRKAIPRVESVVKAETQEPNSFVPTPPLTFHAQYTTSQHALRKWSQERLQLDTFDDGSVEAQFKYEGTTCSNLGHPLEFVFHVKLGPAEGGYTIENARCIPASSDDGYRSMCEYIDKGESFIAVVADERPLFGKPLDDVLTWEREFNPSGCFCESTSRMHKWGLVFEVIHYALAHRTSEAVAVTRRSER
jgi:hypothetical protein